MIKISNSAFASRLDIRFQVGDNFIRIFKFWSDAEKTIPFDITAKSFSIKALTSGRTVVLDFSDYTITDTNILTISKDFEDMDISDGIYYIWEMKEIGETVFSILYGDFIIAVDEEDINTDTDIIINNAVATIDIIATIPQSSGAVSDPIPIEAGVTENPLTILISDYPGFNQNSEIIYREGDTDDGFSRANDLQIDELFLANEFIGFLVDGHGGDTFEKNGSLTLKK